MKTLSDVIREVLEKHGPMENRNQLCEDLVSVLPKDLSTTDEIGRLADVVDNLLGAEALPIPEQTAKAARCGSLTTLRDQLRQLHVDVTGENPWEGQWP